MRLGTPPSRASVRNRREQTKRAGERLGASCLRPAIDLRIALGRCPGIIAGPCTSAISPMEYTCRTHPTRSSRGVTYSTSFDCKQPTGELSGEQVDEHRVRDEIALPELARLLRCARGLCHSCAQAASKCWARMGVATFAGAAHA